MYAVIKKETNDAGQERYSIVSNHETKQEAFTRWVELGDGYDIIDL